MDSSTLAWLFALAIVIGYISAGAIIWLWLRLTDRSTSIEPHSTTPRIPRRPGE